jgi:hypothetical protein
MLCRSRLPLSVKRHISPISPIPATPQIVHYPIGSFHPLLPRMSWSSALPLLSIVPQQLPEIIDRHRQDNHGSDKDTLPVGVNSEEQQTVP